MALLQKYSQTLLKWKSHLPENGLIETILVSDRKVCSKEKERETDIGQSNGIIFFVKLKKRKKKDFRLLQLIACDLTVRVT